MAELIVLLRGNGSESDRRRTIEALRRTTNDVEVCFCDPNSGDVDAGLRGALAGRRRVCIVGSQERNGAFIWDVLRSAPDADVVLLEVGTVVGLGWHELLRDAAYADSVIATASALPGTMLALHDEFGERLDTGATEFSQRPALGEPLWGCVYVRRDALNAATNSRWYGLDRSQRSLLRAEELVLSPGLVHVLATDVVLPTAARPTRAPAWPPTPAVRRALAGIEGTVEPLRVTVDLRCCAFPLSGTQVHALNLVSSLAQREDLRLSVLAPARIDQSVFSHFDSLPASVRRYTTEQSIEPRPQVFHRPYQMLYDSELADAVTLGGRLVLTHQDMILDRTPAYFRSEAEWRAYTVTTALSLMAADEVVFFSEHALGEAVRDGLVDPGKTSVVPPGIDHLDARDSEVIKPAAVGEVLAEGRRPFLLVIGNAYIHKNRLFVLRVAEVLRRQHDWGGAVVFAGGEPGTGASVREERAFLQEHEHLRERFVDLGPVTDGERRWLYRHAVLVVYPTLYEGFGLVPFEAAAAGTACAYSGRSSMAEYLPPEGEILDLGDVAETASRLSAVLESSEAGERITGAIRRAGQSLTWKRAADSYVDIYRRSMTRPVGFSLLSGQGIVAGAMSQAASETERRLIVLFRRSASVRLLTRTVFTAALAVRRFDPRR